MPDLDSDAEREEVFDELGLDPVFFDLTRWIQLSTYTTWATRWRRSNTTTWRIRSSPMTVQTNDLDSSCCSVEHQEEFFNVFISAHLRIGGHENQLSVDGLAHQCEVERIAVMLGKMLEWSEIFKFR